MLNWMMRIGLGLVVLAAAFVSLVPVQPAQAAGSAAVVETIVDEAGIGAVIDLIQTALREHRGLSLDDQAVVYNAIGRTNRAIDLLYDTGATGDVFNTAEHLLFTQVDLLREVEVATISEDIDHLFTVVPMLVDFAQARLAFDRQRSLVAGRPFTPLAASHEVNVIDIARDDAAISAVMADLIVALATGQPVDLELSDAVYRALGETARALDLVDETGQTGDVFEAAVLLLEHRFQFLVDVEDAVISGDLEGLRAVAEDWVALSKEQLTFERQLNDTDRLSRSFLSQRGDSFLGRLSRRGVSRSDVEVHQAQQAHVQTSGRVYTIQPGDTLSGIAQRFGTTVEQLARANNIQQLNLIRPGMSLVIPAVAAQ